MAISTARIVAFIGSALAAATLFAEFAHNELGLSRYIIRVDALMSAIGIAGVLMLLVCSRRLRGKR